MADHDVLSHQQQHQAQQQRRYVAPLSMNPQQLQQQQPQQSSKGASLPQQEQVAHELNESVVGKRKRGTGGGGEGGGGEGGGVSVGFEQDVAKDGDGKRALSSVENNGFEGVRSSKRRNGVEAGGGAGAGGGVATHFEQQHTGTPGDEAVGAIQTRKRKSLEKLGASHAEQDAVTTPVSDKNRKKRKGAAGGVDEGNGVDNPEANDAGTNSQGPALRLRFTRRGNAFSITKKSDAEGIAADGLRNGPDGGEDGDVQNHVNDEVFLPKSDSDARTTAAAAKHSGMEGDRSSAHVLSSEGTAQRISSAGPAAADGAGNSLPPKSPDSRQPLTKEIYRVPSHAGWFSWTKIHNIERRTLSEFFDGKSISKTPKIYKDYRDFIINKYRENMQRTLTFTEVRRMLIGDVNALRRVFDFLDHWGLINNQAAQEANDQTPGVGLSSFHTVVDPVQSGGVRRGGVSPALASLAPIRSGHTDFVASRGFQAETVATYRDAFGPAQNDGVHALPNSEALSDKSAPRINCSSCGKDCAKLLFRCREEIQADFNLCPDCFKQGKYGPGMAARDFIRVEADAETGDQWTTKETLNLLEAITRFGDNWNEVAEHVGSKSRTACVQRFIQLPFGDRFLSDTTGAAPPLEVEGKTNGISEGDADELGTQKHTGAMNIVGHTDANIAGSERAFNDGNGSSRGFKSTTGEEPSPFADQSNPLLAQVAFMSAIVGPRVAAAAAHAAVMAIAEEEPAVAQLPLLSGWAVHSPSSTSKEGGTGGKLTAESLKGVQTSAEAGQQSAHQALQQLPLEKDDGAPTVAQMKAGIGTALGAAAANAKLLADQEEREMEHLMSDIIENQLKRLYAKLEHFEELEMLVEKERHQLEQARQLLYAHHIQFAESRLYLNRDRQGG